MQVRGLVPACHRKLVQLTGSGQLAHQRFHQLALAVARHTSNAQNLARRHGQAEVLHGQRAAVDGLREAMAGKTLRSCS